MAGKKYHLYSKKHIKAESRSDKDKTNEAETSYKVVCFLTESS